MRGKKKKEVKLMRVIVLLLAILVVVIILNYKSLTEKIQLSPEKSQEKAGCLKQCILEKAEKKIVINENVRECILKCYF